jgi:hypothetical protein
MTKPLKAAKAALLEVLRHAAIAFVEIEYDGVGDSGQIHAIIAYTAANVPLSCERLRDTMVALPDKPAMSLEEALDDFAWHLLGLYHDGFVNNDGGYGTIAIAVDTGKITIDHNDRIIDVVNSVTEA